MITRLCDRCHQPIEEGELRYVAKIQVYAAYDPLDITFQELQRDYTKEMEQILEKCKDLTEEELMRDVYVQFQFDLCRACQHAYIKDPMPSAPEEE
jgi:hypothetical protein